MGRETPRPFSDEQKSALVGRIIRGEFTPAQACERHGLSPADLKDWVRVYRREARRAVDDRVKMALSTQGMDVDDLATAEFSGNVEDMAVAELLQTIQFGRKDAEIRLEHDGEQSRIWCVEGEVIDAEASRLAGAPAVYRLLSLERGRVQVDFARVERARTITVSTQTLLMESARRFDECQRLRETLGDTDAVYVPSSRSLSPEVQATAGQFGVLRLFDGIRSLDEVVRVSSTPDLETLTSIAELMRMQLLERARDSRISVQNWPVTVATESAETSFLPLAASLRARPGQPAVLRRWVWAVSALGSATLGAAFALRLTDIRLAQLQGEPVEAVARVEPALPAIATPSQTCPEGTAALGTFCLAKHEVTVSAYEQCITAGECERSLERGDLPSAAMTLELRKRASSVFGDQCNSRPGRETHPINCVSFRQAQRFCTWQGGRLPSEAEWELAAHGAEGRAFPWGNTRPGASLLNACGAECKAEYVAHRLVSVFDSVMYETDDGFTGTAPVGSFPAGKSPEGVLDLIGNVAEWTSSRVDFDDADIEARVENKTPESYVVRGGAFSSGIDALSVPALRQYLNAEVHSRGVGFRCAFEPSPVSNEHRPAR
jgi:formylglycine-generating enzyme required for sulfatase activity/transposase-like protein